MNNQAWLNWNDKWRGQKKTQNIYDNYALKVIEWVKKAYRKPQ